MGRPPKNTLPEPIEPAAIEKPKTEEKTEPVAEAKAPAPVAVKRDFSGTKEVISDCFKLKVANMIKNLDFHFNKWRPAEAEHCHFFHSVSSQGRRQDHASFIGGHTHAIEWKDTPDGPVVEKVGPAVTQVETRSHNGTKVLTLQPVLLKKSIRGGEGEVVPGGEAKYDAHTHEIEYMGSEKIRVSIR